MLTAASHWQASYLYEGVCVPRTYAAEAHVLALSWQVRRHRRRAREHPSMESAIAGSPRLETAEPMHECFTQDALRRARDQYNRWVVSAVCRRPVICLACTSRCFRSIGRTKAVFVARRNAYLGYPLTLVGEPHAHKLEALDRRWLEEGEILFVVGVITELDALLLVRGRRDQGSVGRDRRVPTHSTCTAATAARRNSGLSQRLDPARLLRQS